MIEYKIVIPTYNRQKELEEKTLSLLKKCQIPSENIYIFVANEEEKLSYESSLSPYYKEIIIGVKGIAEQRMFITDYFPEGTKIVSMDDDLSKLSTISEGKLEEVFNFGEIIEQGFSECEKHNCNLWGISPIGNPFYMRKEVSTNLKFCIGHLFGYINDKSLKTVGKGVKSDYEFTIISWLKYGKVIRLNHICAKTKMYAKGGIGSKADRMNDNLVAVQYLLNKYPKLVIENKLKPGEIRLNWKAKHAQF